MKTRKSNYAAKNTDQKGSIDLTFVTVLLVLVVAAVFTFWRIQAADETVSETDTNTANQPVIQSIGTTQANETLEGWVEYTDDTTGISFVHPETWSVQDNTTELGLSLRLTSGDFVETPDTIYGGTDEGVEIIIGKRATDGDQEIDGIVNGTDPLIDSISEISEETTVAGMRSISYGIGYEGPPSYSTLIDANDGHFFVSYRDAPYSNGSTMIMSAEFYEEFMRIVNSFKLNDE